MDQSTCCLWSVEVHEVSWCWCQDCLLQDLHQLPFSADLPCPFEEHERQLAEMIAMCNKAYSAILRLESVVATQPQLVSIKLIPKIIKRQVIIASISIYDAKFQHYLGPDLCTCRNRYIAMQAVKRLHDVCIIAGNSTHYIWSFLPYVPMPIHSVLY